MFRHFKILVKRLANDPSSPETLSRVRVWFLGYAGLSAENTFEVVFITGSYISPSQPLCLSQNTGVVYNFAFHS